MVVPRLEDKAALTLFHNSHVIKGKLTRLRTMVPLQEAYSEPARLIQRSWRRQHNARLMISKVWRGALARLRIFLGTFYPEGRYPRQPRARGRPILPYKSPFTISNYGGVRRTVWASDAQIDYGNRKYRLVKIRNDYDKAGRLSS